MVERTGNESTNQSSANPLSMDPGYCPCKVCRYIDRRHLGAEEEEPKIELSETVKEILSRTYSTS